MVTDRGSGTRIVCMLALQTPHIAFRKCENEQKKKNPAERYYFSIFHYWVLEKKFYSFATRTYCNRSLRNNPIFFSFLIRFGVKKEEKKKRITNDALTDLVRLSFENGILSQTEQFDLESKFCLTKISKSTQQTLNAM